MTDEEACEWIVTSLSASMARLCERDSEQGAFLEEADLLVDRWLDLHGTFVFNDESAVKMLCYWDDRRTALKSDAPMARQKAN